MKVKTLTKILEDCEFAEDKTLDGPNCLVCPLYGKVKLSEQDMSNEFGLEGISLKINPCLMIATIKGKLKEPKTQPELIAGDK